MRITRFDWDAGNKEKCGSRMALDDIESVFERPVLIIDDAEHSQAESRFRAIGTTRDGRKAFVVFTMRHGRLRPISARYMHRREVERYEEDNPDV